MALFHLKNPVFDNIKMMSAQGDVISYTNQKGAARYVEKGMAQWSDEKTICVNFSPLFKNQEQQLYNTQMFENRCVCCGSTEELTKHHIFPNMFVRELSRKVDKNSKHDILLLCETCHEYYELRANSFKGEILKKYPIKLDKNGKSSRQKQEENHKIMAARGFMNRLNGGTSFELNGKLITPPQSAIDEKRAIAEKELNVFTVDEKPRSLGYVMLGAVFVHMSLQEFVQMWRKHFIKVMKPKFLPQHWSVEMPI